MARTTLELPRDVLHTVQQAFREPKVAGAVRAALEFAAAAAPHIAATGARTPAEVARRLFAQPSPVERETLAAVARLVAPYGAPYSAAAAAPPEDPPEVEHRGFPKNRLALDAALPTIRDMRAAGKPYTEIATELNARGFATPSGSGQWWPATVKRLVDEDAAASPKEGNS